MSAVVYELNGEVATLTLNRPGSLNALDPAMVEALQAATRQAAADAKVRVVIVRGAGDHFMAGGDLKWFREQSTLPVDTRRQRFTELLEGVHAAVRELKRMDKPVIAAVQGAVAGFGVSLMLACDLALAAGNSYFTLAYCSIALSPDGGATWSLPRHVGLKRAMEIALLGERFDALRALELGLINRIVEPAQLDAEARQLAQRLAAGPALALARTKALLNASASALPDSLENQLLAEERAFVDCAAHPDFAEGLAAFFEKRRANYARS